MLLGVSSVTDANFLSEFATQRVSLALVKETARVKLSFDKSLHI